MMEFAGKSALVTGAASGIGRAVAEHLAANGAERLILVDRDAAGLASLALPCAVERIAGDVSDEALWARSAPLLDRLDHAVINAGSVGAGAIVDLAFAEWRRVHATNLDGAFLTLQAAMRAMQTGGGTIVAVASAAGIKAEAGVAAYGASKAGLIHLVKVAAKEGAAANIRVNAIAPAGVETPVWDSVPMFAERAAAIGRAAAFIELAAMATPLGRYATAGEVASQIAFLLGDASTLMTGATLLADGGYTL